MTLQDVIVALRSRWWLLIVSAMVGVGIAAGASLMEPPSYSSVAMLFVGTTSHASSASRDADSVFAQSRATTYADLVTSSAVLDAASSQIPNVTAVQLGREISASSPVGTNLVSISATAKSAVGAAAAANAVASSLIKVVDSLENSPDSYESKVTLREVQSASPPLAAASPSLSSLLVVGLMIGFAGGIALALIAQGTSRKLQSARDVLNQCGLYPVHISAPVTSTNDSSAREPYRFLRANLDFALGVRRVILLAPVDSNGTAQVDAAMLSAALSEGGSSVLVLEAGDRGQTPDLDVGPLETSTTSSSTGQFGASPVGVRDGDARGLTAAGPVVKRFDMTAVSPDALREVIDAMAVDYDYVLIATRSALLYSDASAVARHADATLLSVTARSTRRQSLALALDLLQSVGVERARVTVTLHGPYSDESFLGVSRTAFERDRRRTEAAVVPALTGIST